MGQDQNQSAEVIRQLMSQSAKAMLDPAVRDALDVLRRAILDIDANPGLMVSTLTFAAATCGCAQLIPGREADAEAQQIAILRSVYATHQLSRRTIH
jgi:hypothetical protein